EVIPNIPPVITSFTADPISDLAVGDAVAIRLEAEDESNRLGRVASMQILHAGNVLAETQRAGSQLETTFTIPGPGSHSLTARVTDSSGATTEADLVLTVGDVRRLRIQDGREAGQWSITPAHGTVSEDAAATVFEELGPGIDYRLTPAPDGSG
ncbi:MAG: hypothetical protein ACOCXA_04825, partial [Planctomycetota bacterium]